MQRLELTGLNDKKFLNHLQIVWANSFPHFLSTQRGILRILFKFELNYFL